jgi:hypothetical protein
LRRDIAPAPLRDFFNGLMRQSSFHARPLNR